MFSGLESPIHILVVLVVVLLVFGAKRLPEIGRSLGSGLREFKQSVTGEDDHPSRTSEDTLASAAAEAGEQTIARDAERRGERPTP